MSGSNSNNYGAWEWLRSHRVGLGPAYAALPVLLLGVAVHLLDTGPALLSIASYTVGVLFWAARAQGWRRPYFLAAGLASAGWLAWAHLADATVQTWVWLICSLSLATVIGAIPWWSDQVRRTHVRMEMVVRNWRVRGARIGLRDTWLSDVKVAGIGWSGKLSWRPGQYKVDTVEGMRSDIEGALGLEVGQLRLPRDGKSTNSINLVAVLKDPHAAAVMWEIPHTEIDGQLVLKQGSVTDEIELGPQEDGSIKRIRLFELGRGARHVLVGGMNDSGKSGLLNLLWARLALCKDVVQWGIDLKGGVELGAWRKCFDWVVSSRDDAILMATALNAEMQRRYELMAERSATTGKVQRTWIPTAQDPAIVMSIDEAASILGNASGKELDLFEDIARKGRAAGISLILATQYPTLDAIGTSQIREQMHFAFCFRMRSDKGENFVITDTGATIDAHKIDENRPGTCYCQIGSKADKMPLRVFYLDDETVSETSDLAAGLAPVLVAEVEEFLAQVVANAVAEANERDRGLVMPSRWTGENETANETQNENETVNENETTGENEIPPWNENDDVPLGEITEKRDETLSGIESRQLARERDSETETEKLGEDEAREALMNALLAGGGAGVQAKDLQVAATRKSSWLYERLGELERAGRVARTRTGFWALTRENAHAE